MENDENPVSIEKQVFADAQRELASSVTWKAREVFNAGQTMECNFDKDWLHQDYGEKCIELRDKLLQLFPIDDAMKREHAALEVIAKAQRIQASMLEIIEADTGDEIEKCEGCGVLGKISEMRHDNDGIPLCGGCMADLVGESHAEPVEDRLAPMPDYLTAEEGGE